MAARSEIRQTDNLKRRAALDVRVPDTPDMIHAVRNEVTCTEEFADECVEATFAEHRFTFDYNSDHSEDEDAIDIARDLNTDTEMNLLEATKDATKALYLFLNDKPDDAISLIKPKSEQSIYHAVSLSAMYCFKAFITFDPKTIEEAMEVTRKCVDTCNQRRRRYTLTDNVLTRIIVTPSYNEYTEEEIHAELCYCECLLMRAGLTFIYDIGIMALIKGGIKIRKGHQIYKDCLNILQLRTWTNNELRNQFESGVNMGIGCFNLALSMVPSRILKILEFIGFSGNRDLALEKLKEGQRNVSTLRSPLCSIILIAYHIIARYALGNPKRGEGLDYSEQLLVPLVEASPKGVGVQYLQARLDHVRGNVHKAIERLERVLDGRQDNYKLDHVAAWEISWCYCSIGEWRKAIDSMNILWQESMWTKCTYAYAKASMMFMCDDLSDAEREQAIELMTIAPTHLQQIIGRAVPVEKFFCARAQRFLKQGDFLILPAYEMMYLFNLIFILQEKNDVLSGIVGRIDRTIQDLQEERFQQSQWCMDNYCLAIFLKAVCLRHMGALHQAEELFFEVTENQMNIVDDHFVISFALMELGLMYKDNQDYERAIQFLTAARTSSIFLTEFRIHIAIEDIRQTGYHDLLMDKEPPTKLDFL